LKSDTVVKPYLSVAGSAQQTDFILFDFLFVNVHALQVRKFVQYPIASLAVIELKIIAPWAKLAF